MDPSPEPKLTDDNNGTPLVCIRFANHKVLRFDVPVDNLPIMQILHDVDLLPKNVGGRSNGEGSGVDHNFITILVVHLVPHDVHHMLERWSEQFDDEHGYGQPLGGDHLAELVDPGHKLGRVLAIVQRSVVDVLDYQLGKGSSGGLEFDDHLAVVVTTVVADVALAEGS